MNSVLGNPAGIGSKNSKVIHPGFLNLERRAQNFPEFREMGTTVTLSSWYKIPMPD